MSRIRNFCFTLNNPDDHYANDEEMYAFIDFLASECSYFIIGNEVGKSGTPHWQGYAELKVQRTFKKVAAWAPWHIEKRRGTAAQAADYCRKDDDVLIESGEISQQGRRVDIEHLKRLAVTPGEGLKAVIAEADSLQQFRVAQEYAIQWAPKRDHNVEPNVIYIWGPTGVGKSKMAHEMLEDVPYYSKEPGEWWTGYNSEEWVLMDDFRDTWMPFNTALRVLDRYPYRVRVHGSMMQLCATNFIITSAMPPEDLYAGTSSESRDQILRRITSVIEICATGEVLTSGSPYSKVGGNTNPPTCEYDDEDFIMNPNSAAAAARG